MNSIGELHDSLTPGETTHLTYAGLTFEITRPDPTRREEDEGLTERQMDEERAADEEAEQAWREERP